VAFGPATCPFVAMRPSRDWRRCRGGPLKQKHNDELHSFAHAKMVRLPRDRVPRYHALIVRKLHYSMLARGVVIAVGMASLWMAGPAGATSTRWQNCGSVKQRPQNGYVSTNRVQARNGTSCAVARHIGLHFQSGGYSYRGLTCFYASMGSGNPYWNWSCGPGTTGRKSGTPDKVRGHLTVTKH